jgi:hypothetical protein
MTILQILTVIIAFGALIVNMFTQKSNIENVEKLVYYRAIEKEKANKAIKKEIKKSIKKVIKKKNKK